jgi:hypothetical protein
VGKFPQDEKSEFERLLLDGKMAFDRGERKLAHDLWRLAAMIEPFNEQVWMSLLDVLDDPDDRRVCLQNIVAINPMNAYARRVLRADQNERERKKQVYREMHERQNTLRRRRWIVLRRGVVMGILLALSGIVFAVALILITVVRG